jgi:hypothetical protein
MDMKGVLLQKTQTGNHLNRKPVPSQASGTDLGYQTPPLRDFTGQRPKRGRWIVFFAKSQRGGVSRTSTTRGGYQNARVDSGVSPTATLLGTNWGEVLPGKTRSISIEPLMTKPLVRMTIGWRTLYLSIALLSLLSGSNCIFAVPEVGGEPLRKLPTISHNRLRLVDGVDYCHAGYGTQRLVFEIQGQTATGIDTLAAPMPIFQPLTTTFLKFGCVRNRLFIEYSLIRDTMRFSDTLVYDGAIYDGISFQSSTAAAGYIFSPWAHRLYFDLGVGYNQIDYYLRSLRVDSGNGAVDRDSHFALLAAARFIVNAFVFVQWQHMKGLENAVVSYSNQLGFHFMVRF